MNKILVIEDEHLVRENLLERLEAENFKTISAENGLDGVLLAQEHRPDLIICDVMMPELDGYGVLSVLRGDPVTATIPFIFLTAQADKDDVRQGMELGADDYLTKPFTKTELLRAIAVRLEKQVAVAQHSEKKLQALRRSITDAMPQELLLPLNEILGFSRMLIDDYDSVKPHEILETAQNINTSAERMHRLVENFMMYAQIELLATSSEEVKALNNCNTLNPREIIVKISTQKAKQNHREADLILEVANTSVRLAKQDLKKVVEELIDNAFKFSEAGTPVHVKTTAVNDIFNLCITNYGRKMTPEQIASIGACMQFERKFYEQQGLGLGLIIAKRITELHGGQLTIQSKPNSQTTVCVALRRGGDAPYPLGV
jgi:CheY-like chemotaxis protein/anti-sigma regulatory factor (Ser/Thr protein kinase)